MNASNSVELLLDGGEENIYKFLPGLKREHPPMAVVKEITVMNTQTNEKFGDFVIRKSQEDGGSNSIIPSDVSICKAKQNLLSCKINFRHYL